MIPSLSVAGTFLLFILIAFSMWGCPQYNVYTQRLDGEAELAKAEYSRQVAVREAQAKKDSASLLADAEVARAHGVAQANEIIGKSLQNNEAYLKYLWITDVTGNKTPTVIYVPTEANIPILEAGRTAGVAK
jgi:regulator of protease activity HflC (stomatin/prohibitin superfamily)